MTTCDVTIVGAGPYGLSTAAHLRTIKGLEVLVFGEPMSFWERHMPVGMLLRSNWTATQIADPNRSLTLEAYQAASSNHLSHPVPLDRFIQYGLWYQRQAVPDLDQRKIARIESGPSGFRVILADGDVIRSRRVVVAGLALVRTPRPEPVCRPATGRDRCRPERARVGRIVARRRCRSRSHRAVTSNSLASRLCLEDASSPPGLIYQTAPLRAHRRWSCRHQSAYGEARLAQKAAPRTSRQALEAIGSTGWLALAGGAAPERTHKARTFRCFCHRSWRASESPVGRR